MRYLVISPCEDVRSGVEFEPGDEFLPEPELDQAERLTKAGCLRVIPDSAPDLPGGDATARTIADLQDEVARLGGTLNTANETSGQLLDEANRKIGLLTAEVSDLHQVHAPLVEERDGLKAQLLTAERALEEARGQIESLTGERDTAQTELAAATKRIGELETAAKPAARSKAN